MPVYNTEEDLLTASIRSIQEQTYKKIELIVVDDGSECQCAELCDKLADDRTRVFHIKNAGVSAARNKGIQESSGEYIAFIDSDDSMARSAVQTMIEEIDNVDFVSIGCQHVQVASVYGCETTKQTVIADKAECIDYLCYMDPPYNHIETNAVWGKLYKKSVLGKLRFATDMTMAEDSKFNFEYIMNSQNGKYLDYNGYNYLIHSDSISRKYKPVMMNTIDEIDRMIQEWENTDFFDALISRCVNIAFTILMLVPNEMKNEQRRIERFISEFRYRVARNPKTRKKVRFAVLSSYLGYRVTRMTFHIIT